MGLRLVTPAQAEPFDKVVAKKHLRLDADFNDQDDELDEMIAAVREEFEAYAGISLFTQTWDMTLRAFPSWAIRIPRPPLQDIVHVKYVDPAGDLQTLDAAKYTWASDRRPGLLVPAIHESWPATQIQTLDAVQVRFDCGYGDHDADPFPLPPRAMRGMKLALSDLWEFAGTLSDWKRENDGRMERFFYEYSS